MARYVGTLAAACAEVGDFDSAVKWQTRANSLYSNKIEKSAGEERLKLYQEKKPYRDLTPDDIRARYEIKEASVFREADQNVLAWGSPDRIWR